MTISQLPSGRWRAQVWHDGKWIPVAPVIAADPDTPVELRGKSYRTKTDAKNAKKLAQVRLGGLSSSGVTVREWRDRWISDPLFVRPKESTMLHNAERVRAFVDGDRDPRTKKRNGGYGHLPISAVTDLTVAEYRKGGKREATIPALRAMFNDAASRDAGRLITSNPFAGLNVRKGTGNKDKAPPSPQQLRHMLDLARDMTPPSFADYLEAGGLTAIRPSELDALTVPQIDFAAGEIDVHTQWSAKVRKFTPPKYGPYVAALVPQAAKLLRATLARREESDAEFVFLTLRGTHYTPTSRTHHWNRVRAAAGLGDMTLYLATRHYFGWYAVNVLGLDTAVVAEQLGHKDGGRLVEELYGHPDKAIRRGKIRDAFAQDGTVVPIRRKRDGS